MSLLAESPMFLEKIYITSVVSLRRICDDDTSMLWHPLFCAYGTRMLLLVNLSFVVSKQIIAD